MAPRLRSAAAATAIVLALAYGPLVAKFFAHQWARTHYQHFPFVLAAFAWLLWQRASLATPRDDSENGSPLGRRARRYGSPALLAAAWALLALACVAESAWLAYVSALVVVTSWLVDLSRQWQLPNLAGLWLLPWLVVPLPFNRDQHAIAWLQQVSSGLSSRLLDRLRVTHLMDGNTLLLPGRHFFVDEACSGIVSVMSIVAFSVIYGVWRSRSLVHLLLLSVAGIGWATLMNVVRISAIAVAFDRYGVDWSEGTPHAAVGLALFLATFLAVVSTDAALRALLAPIRSEAGEACNPIEYGSQLVSGWDRLAGRQTCDAGEPAAPLDGVPLARPAILAREGCRFGLVPLLAFGALAAAQFAFPELSARPRRGPSTALDRARELRADALPARIGSLTRTQFSAEERPQGDVFGDHSRTYEYRGDQGHLLLVSCDFPFGPLWHDLTTCYRGLGWRLTAYRVRTDGEPLEPVGGRELPESRESPEPREAPAPFDRWGIVEATFDKPDGSVAFLAYCVFDEHGTAISPPAYLHLDQLWHAFRKSLRAERIGRLLQVQVWTSSVGGISEERKKDARRLLVEARERFRVAIIEPTGQLPLPPPHPSPQRTAEDARR